MAGENLPPVHVVIMFVATVIYTLLQLKFQSAKVTPYEERGAIRWAIHISLLIYCAVLAIQVTCQIPNQAPHLIIKRLSPLLGALFVITLMLLLNPYLGWFAFALWVILLAATLRKSRPEIEEMYESIKEKIDRYFQRN